MPARLIKTWEEGNISPPRNKKKKKEKRKDRQVRAANPSEEISRQSLWLFEMMNEAEMATQANMHLDNYSKLSG